MNSVNHSREHAVTNAKRPWSAEATPPLSNRTPWKSQLELGSRNSHPPSLFANRFELRDRLQVFRATGGFLRRDETLEIDE